MNVATQQNVAPAVNEHFLAIERSFEALSHHGFFCYSVLADQKELKTYKIQRDPAIDDGRVHLVDDLSAQIQPATGADFGAEVTTIRHGSEKVRALARTMQSLSLQSAESPTVFQDIDVMAQLVLHELNSIDEAIEDLDN